MNTIYTVIILAAAFLAVFVQASFNGLRDLLGVQVDLLPGLLVYASLTCSLFTVCLLAFWGGLWFDSLSANPLGVSVLPLVLIGFVLKRYRGLILREQTFAQVVLGTAASALTPIFTLLLLLSAAQQPLAGWFSVWQWTVMSLAGGALTPVWFRLFDRVARALSYQPWDQSSFRPDREIKRGRT